MKFAWTVQGDDPDFNHGDRHGIDGYFMPMFDQPLTSRAALLDVKRRGHAAGIYLGAGWLNINDPVALVNQVENEYLRCLVPGLKVMFNLEEHDPARILAVLKEWRRRRPTVGTSWSMEPKQGGWMGGNMAKGQPQSQFVTELLKLKVRLVPQLFFGNMTPAGEADVCWDLACRGIPASVISPFYNAAALPADWDGYAFTVGTLP